VRKKLTSRSLLGKIHSDSGGEIKPEKQAHFTDFECKIEN
jgi:hypothetical protein